MANSESQRQAALWVVSLIVTATLACWYATTIASNRPYCIAAGISLTTIVLWWKRRGGPSDRLTCNRWGHVIAAGTLLSLSLVTGPWVGLMGAIILLHCALSHIQDGERGCSLAYLTLLPVVCLRLPAGLSERISNRLGQESARIAGLLLDQTGILHDRDSTTLYFASGQVSVSDVTSDAACVVVFMACAAALVCIRRRRLLEVLPALGIAAICSVVITTSALCLRVSQPQLSESVIVSLPLLSLIAFLVLFAVAEAGMALLTASIPMVAGSVARGQGYVNPCIVLWNDIALTRSNDDINSRQELPELWPIITARRAGVRRWLTWFGGWLTAWFNSRNWMSLALNLPLLLVLLTAVYACVQAPENMSGRYQVAMEDAMRKKQAATAEFVLNRLEKEGVADLAFLHEFAIQVVSEGHPEIARPHVQRLTPFESAGYPPTRKWLVNQSLEPKAVFPLTSAERVRHLNTGIRFHPSDVGFLEPLARELVETGQLSVAEQLLERAAGLKPELAEVLVRVKARLGRNHDATVEVTHEYVKRLTRELKQHSGASNSKAEDTAIALARLYTRQGNTAAAEAVLRSQPNAPESAKIQRALSTLHSTTGGRQLSTGYANAEARSLFMKAIEENPANLRAAVSLYDLAMAEGTLTSVKISQAISRLKNRVGADHSASVGSLSLVNLLAATGQYDEAAKILRRMKGRPPQATIKLIRMLHLTGESAEISGLITHLKKKLVPVPAGHIPVNSVWLIARAYAAADRHDDTVRWIESTRGVDSAQWPEELRRTYQESLQARVSAGANPLDKTDALTAFDMLKESMATNPDNPQALLRLIDLSRQETADGQAAKSLLVARLADPVHMQETRRAMGYAALLREDYEEAVELLKRCVEANPGDAAQLNNLAHAYVRGSTDDAAEALLWINKALDYVPTHPDFKVTRAEVLIALRRWDDARRDIDAVLAVDPDHEAALAMQAAIESRGTTSSGE